MAPSCSPAASWCEWFKCRQRLGQKVFSLVGYRFPTYWERSIHHLIAVEVFFFWHMIGVILFCNNIPCATNFFITIVLDHSFTENMISKESIMDSFELSLTASLFQIMGQMIWSFPRSVAMKSSLLDYVFWKWKKSPSYIQWRLDWPLFLLRDARMYNRLCLHSNMIGMLCIASWSPSRTIQTALRCPSPESFALSSYWTGCRLCFVVNRIEEHVGEGGSRSSWPIHEHDSSQFVSQQNVAIQAFRSRWPPRSALIIRGSWLASRPDNGFLRSIVQLILLQRLGTFWNLCDSFQRVAPFYHVPFQRWDHCCHQMNVFGLPPEATTDCFVLSCLTVSSWKNFQSLDNGTFFHLPWFSC